MRFEPHSLESFYDGPRGGVAARLIGQRLARFWPDLRGRALLGLGHATPYLEPWHGQALRCVAAGGPGRTRAWPPALNASCVAEDDALPFADLCFDRVLLVHGLEAAENPRRLLREVWRVLADDGRLLVVAANRRGMWAHAETTPFGQGQPFSQGQLTRLLTTCLFRPERRDAALFMPPLRAGAVLRSANLVEAVARPLLPALAGVVICEACKDVLAALPEFAKAPRRTARRMMVVDAG